MNTRRDKDSRPLGESIQKMLSEYSLKRKFDETDLVASWRKMVGDPIANRTTRIYIREDKLFVEIESSALKSELLMSRSKILQRIEDQFGKGIVREIIFL